MHKMLRSELDASARNKALYTSLHHSLRLDSGIGSATSSESDGSDSEKLRKESWKGIGYFPNWTRIKRFYGIPKPSLTVGCGRPLSDGFDQQPSSSLITLSKIPFTLPESPSASIDNDDNSGHNNNNDHHQQQRYSAQHTLLTNNTNQVINVTQMTTTKHRSDTIP